MIKKSIQFIFLILTILSCNNEKEFIISNKNLSRTVSINDGKLFTTKIENKFAGKTLIPGNTTEFKLRISEGTNLEGTDVELSSEDFVFKRVLKNEKSALGFLLENKKYGLEVEVHYELEGNNTFLHKYLKINCNSSITLERIDVECISFEDIYQPYQMKQITARGAAKWRPGLGQPLYTANTATFWGIEFPASYNFVEEKTGYCGYLWGKGLNKNETYTSYKSVMGVGDDSAFIQETFFDYIDKIRIRPLRLQVQYNSWFDLGGRVSKESFGESVSKVHHELVTKRGVPPLKAYVIDDGWQDVNADWSDTCWKVNDKFDADFKFSKTNIEKAGSNLGLWLSPGCLFGAQKAAKKYKEQGFETLDNWMSMAGPKYMQLLENRMVELTQNGVSYFKLDGIFGHLIIREFELNGHKYGIPHMPQLGTDTLSASDKVLNDPKFDELKTYYLVAGTERLMQIFEKQHQINPDVYIVISNGAYLSPWWLMYIDAVWMINAGDAAKGSNRNDELVYRDGVYYNTWQIEKTQFPIHSVFNHEPKKRETGESVKQFSEYLWMNLSRGTGFIELYIKTEKLSDKDWDVLASGLKWAHEVFPCFKKAKMHGGNPKNKEVYGYTGWNDTGGYISFHNPSAKEKIYQFVLNRHIGLEKETESFIVSSPLSNAKEFSGRTVSYNDNLEITLAPGEVKVLEFNIN